MDRKAVVYAQDVLELFGAMAVLIALSRAANMDPDAIIDEILRAMNAACEELLSAQDREAEASTSPSVPTGGYL